jgi:hypothetical protein
MKAPRHASVTTQKLISMKLFGKSKARRTPVEPARKSSEFARSGVRKLACHAGLRIRVDRRTGGVPTAIC